MKTSESIIKITPAFLKAQQKIESVIKDATNPYFKSKYADLTSVIDACKTQLNANDIAILQPIDGMSVETILVHTSGEWFSSSTPIVCKAQNDPQALGSAITYAKRYGLQSMVLLPAEDDDGQTASRSSTPAKTEKERGDALDDVDWLNKQDAQSEDGGVTTNDHYCLIHKTELKQRTTKTGGHYWDHRAKLNDQMVYDQVNGLWHACDGKSDWKIQGNQ